ncbi:MAG: hypothetical protein GY917_20495 [Planctomycetaceae bacterium]|nr:hypothetical protein [Planctomycetaceae bacterium]
MSRPSKSVPQRYFRLGNRPGITFYLYCPEEAPFCPGNPADAGKEIRASNQGWLPGGIVPRGIAWHISAAGAPGLH